jgi:hypothetical protein
MALGSMAMNHLKTLVWLRLYDQPCGHRSW